MRKKLVRKQKKKITQNSRCTQAKVPIQGRALITGGTSGMGYAFAQQLAQRGLDLVLVARDAQRLARVATELQAQYEIAVEILPADLMTAAGFAQVKARLETDRAPVTVFINNAGAGCYERLVSRDYTQIRKSAELMALAPMELGGAAALAMKARGAGLIISTISFAALVPMGAYSAIKAMLKFWSDSLYTELLGTGVHVVSFLPSWVRTEFHARTGVSNSSIPAWMWLSADQAVAEALAAAAAGKPTAIPGRKIRILAFLAKHAPASVLRKVGQKLNKGRR